MAFAKRFVGAICVAMVVVGAIAMVLMMVHIVTDGVMRTFFSKSAPGTMEFASFYYMVAVTFLPLAYIHATRGHVIIELFTGGLPRKVVYGIDSAVGFLLSVGAAIFAYAATWKALAMTRAGEYAIGMIIVPTWQTRWLVVAGVGMLAVVALLEAIDDLAVASGRRSVEEGDRLRTQQVTWLEHFFGLHSAVEKH